MSGLFPPLFQEILVQFEHIPADVDIELGDSIFLGEAFVKKFDMRYDSQQIGINIQTLIDIAVLLQQIVVGVAIGDGNIVEKLKDLFLDIVESFNLFIEGPGVEGISLVLVDHAADLLLLEVVLLPGADVAEAGEGDPHVFLWALHYLWNCNIYQIELLLLYQLYKRKEKSQF